MSQIKQIGQSEEKYRGKSFQITHRLMQTGDKQKTFEEARRAPGTRSIILSSDNKKILLTKEHRHYLNSVDFRLPGGKVFDSLDEYLTFLESGGEITRIAEDAAKKEILEETGQIVDEIKLFRKTVCGGMMEWDLYYFVVSKSHQSPSGQQLGSGEEIENVWVDIDEVVKLCVNGELKEDRSVSVLMQFIYSMQKYDERKI